MSRLEFFWVDVFTTTQFGGNPLAVFPDARNLDAAFMQRIAFELNLSETTFVMPSERDDCDVRVRIFTPRSEMPMAGHPTVGTAFVLGALAEQAGDVRDRMVFEEGVGPVPVERVRTASGEVRWRMTQPRPRFAPGPEAGEVAAALGLDRDDLEPALPIEAVATGPPFVCVALRSLEALGRARADAERWRKIETRSDGALPYLFVPTGAGTARARMFAPSQGIAEDAATGGAAGPLGAFALANGLVTPDGDGVARLAITQGVEMGRPSAIHVEVEGRGRDVTAVRVAGACVAVASGHFDA